MLFATPSPGKLGLAVVRSLVVGFLLLKSVQYSCALGADAASYLNNLNNFTHLPPSHLLPPPPPQALLG